jgi:hypothetical protein
MVLGIRESSYNSVATPLPIRICFSSFCQPQSVVGERTGSSGSRLAPNGILLLLRNCSAGKCYTHTPGSMRRDGLALAWDGRVRECARECVIERKRRERSSSFELGMGLRPVTSTWGLTSLAAPDKCSEVADGVMAGTIRCVSFPRADAGNAPIRFDEREQEPSQTRLATAESAVKPHRETNATPLIDS